MFKRFAELVSIWLPWVVITLFGVVVGLVILIVSLRDDFPTTEDLTNINETVNEQRKLIDNASETLAEEKEARTALERQIRSLGEKPDTVTLPSTPFVPVPGERGRQGKPGERGISGESITGPQGPMFPTDRAISILQGIFNDFCANNKCTATDGENGRGIARVECSNLTSKFVIFYTDDTSQVVDDSQCKNVVVPKEEESE